MELEKRLDGREANESILNLEIDRLRVRRRREETNKTIRKYAYIGILVSSFVASYIVLSRHPEYLDSIKETAINLIERFGY